MEEVPIQFSAKTIKLEGLLRAPKKADSLVILVHGFSGTMDGPGGVFEELSEELAKQGFAVLRFNFRYTSKDWAEFQKMTVKGELDDLKLIVRKMAKRFKNIGLLGESMGGLVSILSCGSDIKSMVLWYPVLRPMKTLLRDELLSKEARAELKSKGYTTQFKQSTGQYYKVSKRFVGELQKLNLIPFAKRVSCPTLVIHPVKDATVPLNQAGELIGLLRGTKRLAKIPNSDHAWWKVERDERNPKAQEKAIKLSVDWFKKTLRASP